MMEPRPRAPLAERLFQAIERFTKAQVELSRPADGATPYGLQCLDEERNSARWELMLVIDELVG
jgi:hypothetical protein